MRGISCKQLFRFRIQTINLTSCAHAAQPPGKAHSTTILPVNGTRPAGIAVNQFDELLFKQTLRPPAPPFLFVRVLHMSGQIGAAGQQLKRKGGGINLY